MNKNILFLLSFVWMLCPLKLIDAATAFELTQYGITWTFDKEYEYGQFANGDYWVVGPVKIINIDPAPAGGRNGSMVNPRYSSYQGYDNRAVRFDETLYRVPPIDLNPGDTIISCISLEEIQRKSYIKSNAVLTIVDVAQSADKFRPPYARSERVSRSSDDLLIFSTNSIKWDYLPRVPKIPNTPDIAVSAAKLQRINSEHARGWDTRNTVNAIDGPPQYGRDISNVVSEISMQLVLNYTNEEKMPAIINLIQYGIDLYGVYLDGGSWAPDGGIYCGRKWPLLFTGIMLDNDIKNISMPPQRFQEDGQTFYVTRHPLGDEAPPGNTDYDIFAPPYPLREYYWSGNTYKTGNVKVTKGSKIVEGIGTKWAQDSKVQYGYSFGVENDVEAYKLDGRAYYIEEVIDDTHLKLTQRYRGETDHTGTATYKIQGAENGRFRILNTYGHGSGAKGVDFKEYSAEHEGMPEWGIRHWMPNYHFYDGLDWEASYRRCCNASSWAGFVLAAIMMEEKTGSKTLWNHPAFFDFQDRYMQVELELGTKGSWLRQWSRFVENMWDTYRNDYPPVWQGELHIYQTPTDAMTRDEDSQFDTHRDDPFVEDGVVKVSLLQVTNNIIKSGQNASAKIKCYVKDAGKLRVAIYNSKGKETITLFSDNAAPGIYEFDWEAMDSSGKKVGSGVYMVHMKSGSYTETKKIVVIK